LGREGEFSRALLIGCLGLPEITPVSTDLADGPLSDLGRQSAEFGSGLQAMGELGVSRNVFVSEESLPYNIKCGIVQILGCKTGRIDGGKARIMAIDEVLLNQLHGLDSLIVQMF
jgi:hypothetical protein